MTREISFNIRNKAPDECGAIFSMSQGDSQESIQESYQEDFFSFRAGLIISKKVSRRAVTRNLVRRRLKAILDELFALRAGDSGTQPYDLVVIAKKGIENVSWWVLLEHMVYAFRWLEKRAFVRASDSLFQGNT